MLWDHRLVKINKVELISNDILRCINFLRKKVLFCHNWTCIHWRLLLITNNVLHWVIITTPFSERYILLSLLPITNFTKTPLQVLYVTNGHLTAFNVNSQLSPVSPGGVMFTTLTCLTIPAHLMGDCFRNHYLQHAWFLVLLVQM